MRPDGTPFGVTLLAPARRRCRAGGASAACFMPHTELAARRARARRSRRSRGQRPRRAPAKSRSPSSARISPACRSTASCARSARRLIERAATAPHYRLYALAGTQPPKPGLLRVRNGAGAAIAVEVWALSESGVRPLRRRSAAAVVDRHARTCATAASVKGFLVEAEAVAGARDISSFGGWRAFMAQEDAPV